MFNLVTFQMMYQTINWKTRLDRFVVSQVCRLIRMTLRVVIASLFQDIVEMINKRVIVKFVNQKYSKGLLYKKKSRVAGTSRMSISQVRYQCLCHYVLTIDLFGVRVNIFREDAKYIRYFVSAEHFQLKFSRVGSRKISHVTDISTFHDKEEQFVAIFILQ